jgi:2'-5' RNA ligase
MRIFIGIDLDFDLRARIERFIEGIQGFAPDARWIHPESLHITLKFIGEQPPERVKAIAEKLQAIEAKPFDIRLAESGFFPTAKAPRVFWIGVHAGPQLATLAKNIDEAVAQLGVPPEERKYNPHLTLARGGLGTNSGSPKWRKGDGPNSIFASLQKRLAGMSALDFSQMTVREFILYQSQLSPRGSKYTKLQSFLLDES